MTGRNNQEFTTVPGESSCILVALSITSSCLDYLIHARGPHWRIDTLYMFLYSLNFLCFLITNTRTCSFLNMQGIISSCPDTSPASSRSPFSPAPVPTTRWRCQEAMTQVEMSIFQWGNWEFHVQPRYIFQTVPLGCSRSRSLVAEIIAASEFLYHLEHRSRQMNKTCLLCLEKHICGGVWMPGILSFSVLG